jgi:hypothetical protein
MNVLNKLKDRWGVTTILQVFVILIVFSLTGFSTLYAHNFIDFLLGINSDTSIWIKAIIFIFLILPIFSVFLFLWGTILGQRKFVTEFLKYKIGLFYRRNKK